MKTAEEVADDFLYRHGHNPNWGLEESVKQLVQALTAYAEERVKEAKEEVERQQRISGALIQKNKEAWALARAIALEEAAKIADEIEHEDEWGECCGNEERIAEKIRALKDKP